ncbi:MAG: hypothetical protein HON53_00925 [Planctomycetaceae bacterium]|jgi:hypothetical protein|nr:hypothetical protein [Planctomycetaceae bacterium]MBT6157561.1 hypothetical protein [Planctomycetaceae bacterium]MBT6488037.1 hypothetical protein [Planctomycetaceae bacterium]MBT6497823.1 hypothetical protein [Planctomycetaceae bacterium]
MRYRSYLLATLFLVVSGAVLAADKPLTITPADPPLLKNVDVSLEIVGSSKIPAGESLLCKVDAKGISSPKYTWSVTFGDSLQIAVKDSTSDSLLIKKTEPGTYKVKLALEGEVAVFIEGPPLSIKSEKKTFTIEKSFEVGTAKPPADGGVAGEKITEDELKSVLDKGNIKDQTKRETAKRLLKVLAALRKNITVAKDSIDQLDKEFKDVFKERAKDEDWKNHAARYKEDWDSKTNELLVYLRRSVGTSTKRLEEELDRIKDKLDVVAGNSPTKTDGDVADTAKGLLNEIAIRIFGKIFDNLIFSQQTRVFNEAYSQLFQSRQRSTAGQFYYRSTRRYSYSDDYDDD